MGFTFKEKLIRILEEHRSLVVVCFCLPASLIFTYVTSFIVFIQEKLSLYGKDHQSRVKYVQKQVKSWALLPEKGRKKMVNGRPNWQSLSLKFFRKHECHQIRVPGKQVVRLDEQKKTVVVEPYVTIGAVTDYLVERGFMLACTIEIRDATCGGLAMGVGMSTHSHKVGLYQETVLSYGVVLPSGEYVEATCDNAYADLYHALPWSHGSLAILVSLTLQVIPVKPFIRVQYRPMKGLTTFCDAVRRYSGALGPSHTAETPDFVEATVFSQNEAVVMTGDFTHYDLARDSASGITFNCVNRWYKPYFYKHVESLLGRPVDGDGVCATEIIPLKDYIFRHNRSIFWVLADIITFCHNPFFRLLLGWLCPPKPSFLKFTTTQGIRELTCVKQVFQDIVLPMTALESSIRESERLFQLYPVLVYPCRIPMRHDGSTRLLRSPRPDQMTPGTEYGLFYDLGVYGVPGPVKRHQQYDAAAAMRAMERFIRDNGGYTFLYADIFMTYAEFEEMFELDGYNDVRRKYGSDHAFHHVYDKVKPECDVFEISRRYAEAPAGSSGGGDSEAKKIQ